MEERKLTAARMADFAKHMRGEEQSKGTLEKYARDLRAFALWLDGGGVTKEALAGWKEHLVEENYAPVTINSMISAVHAFLRYVGWNDCRVKYLKLQRRMFRPASRELSRDEYGRLVNTARTLGRERLALVMETMGATGIRVSEVRYVTVEAARAGRAEISLKGKIRTILLPAKLCRKLLRYAREEKIASGEVFLSRGGNTLSRKQIWADMKSLCEDAGIEATKVFPHNLRHLFATAFYKLDRDIAKLADVLGHASIETTRIYLISTGMEHAKQMEQLGLVS